MFWSMARPEPVTRFVLMGGVAALLIGAGAAPAATPFPLAPCAIGAQRLTADTTLAAARQAIARAFPSATFQDGTGTDPSRRQLRVTEGGAPLMIVSYYPRTAGRLLATVELLSPRFELMPGVRPGVPLAVAARSIGPIQLSYNPETQVEQIDAPALEQVLAGWQGKGCVVNPRLGPNGRVGLYPAGATETRRYRSTAIIRQIEIAF
ncbi:MAG TPA: hypothetical protein VF649_09460 [Sphingomonas sp.]|jgi:hypothetical protein|uniref:hypothetical protein n=1 Tax=Sphingomonas sp. TaxID=28214 RepID=UPI002ED7DED7